LSGSFLGAARQECSKMRRFLIISLLAAAAAVPSAAMAQDVDGEISRAERREARQQQRQERREARQELQQPRAIEVQAAPRVERQERREDRREDRRANRGGVIPEGAWIGNPTIRGWRSTGAATSGSSARMLARTGRRSSSRR
jgi:Ni/Co efflux regulator RcnB